MKRAVILAVLYLGTVHASLADEARYALVANSGDGTLSTYLVDGLTRVPRHQGYSLAGTSPRAIALTSSQRFAYVVADTNRVLGFEIHSNGALTPVPGTPVVLPANSRPRGVAIFSSFLYVTNSGSNTVTVLRINGADGGLSAASDLAGLQLTQTAPTAAATHPTNKSLYVANSGSNSLSVLALTGAESGFLTALGTVNTGIAPNAVVVHPNGNFVLVANFSSASISVFRVQANRTLTAVAGSPFAVGSGPSAIAIHPNQTRLFVTNAASNSVTILQISLFTGALTRIADIGGYAAPSAVAVEPQGEFLYVAQENSDSIAVERIASSGESLTRETEIRTRVAPRALVLSRGPATVAFDPVSYYGIHRPQPGGDELLQQMPIDDLGAPTLPPVASSPLPSGTLAQEWHRHPSGRFVYLRDGGELRFLALDESTGLLVDDPARLQTLPTFLRSPQLDPSGRFVFVPRLLPGPPDRCEILVNAVDQTSGGLTQTSSVVLNDGDCRDLVVEPSGQFLYVRSGPSLRRLVGFTINPVSGVLTRINQLVDLNPLPAPQRVVVEPSGRFMYLITQGFNLFTIGINQRSGLVALNTNQPAQVPQAQGAFLLLPIADPVGRSLGVIDNTGRVSTFSILGSGQLFPRQIQTVTVPFNTVAFLNNHPSGEFLYVSDIQNPTTITRLRRDIATGALLPAGSTATGMQLVQSPLVLGTPR